MPLPRFSRLPQREQDALLDIAGSEFGERGYADASLNRILKKARLSKGALYYYFSDKDDLYAAVVERAVARFSGQFVTPDFTPKNAREFWSGVEALAARGFELARTHPAEMQQLRSFQRDLRKHRKPAFENALGMVRAQFRVLVQVGQKLGCVRDDVDEELLVELLEAIDTVVDARLFAEKAPFSPATAKRYAALSIDLGKRLTRKEKRP